MLKRRIILCILSVLIGFMYTSQVAADDLMDVKVGSGPLKIGGILQCWYFNTQDEAQVQSSFQMKRARLLFWGEIVPEKVKYFIQTDGVGSPFVLDVKLQFYFIPNTEIAFGRFLPNFTQYMPRSTAKLDLINYPLVVLRYAMWRQVGIQTTTRTKFADFNLGLFNGPANNWTDNNDAKDFFARVSLKPANRIRLGGYRWQGKSLEGESDMDVTRTGAFLDISLDKGVFNAEYITGKDGELASKGFYAHMGFKVLPKVELLARYDSFDPNTDMEDNGETWITTGLNYFIQSDRAKIFLNYIIKQEETHSIDNNEFIVQTQIFF